MKLIKSVNLMENKKVIFWLNVWGTVIIIPFLIIFTLIADTQVLSETGIEFTFDLETILWIMSIFPILMIHELIHGVFFKIFNPEGKVKYGFKNGMAYATSPNSYYSKLKFFIIGISPFVIITSILILMYFIGIVPKISFIFIASLHAAGCVGDFYWSYLLFRSPKNILVEDTEVGINFYSQNE